MTDVRPPSNPESLKDAVNDFIITGAMRLLNKDYNDQFHHSMLVHAHIEISNHERLAKYIRNYGVNLKEKYLRQSLFGNRNKAYQDMKERWENRFNISTDEERSMDNAIKKFFSKFDFDSDVLTINSNKEEEENLFETNSRLEYKYEGTWVIVVGGTLLSRGLTVEGLVISYFARESAMYDSLTQMARWCGYHSNFVKKLIQVNITETIHRWFQFIYDVDTRIREDVAVLESRPDVTPIDLAPRILQYNREEEVFLPTRRGALQHAELRNLSHSGTTPSTLHLCLESNELLMKNEQLLFHLLNQINEQKWSNLSIGGGVKIPVSFSHVKYFMENFNQKEGKGIEINGILRYIESCREQGELDNWTLVVFSPENSSPTNLDWNTEFLGFVPNKTKRGKMRNDRLDVLFDKRHLFADLEGELIGETRSLGRRLAREIRPSAKGLIAIYILDGEYEPTGSNGRDFVRLHDNASKTRDVIAFGIALPESEVTVGDNFWLAHGVNPVRD